MIVTKENYLKSQTQLHSLRAQIKGIPNVFNNASFEVKNKISKLAKLEKAIKIFERKKSDC